MSQIKSKLLCGRVSDITKVNAYSKSFDFLNNESDIYSTKDILQVAIILGGIGTLSKNDFEEVKKKLQVYLGF